MTIALAGTALILLAQDAPQIHWRTDWEGIRVGAVDTLRTLSVDDIRRTIPNARPTTFERVIFYGAPNVPYTANPNEVLWWNNSIDQWHRWLKRAGLPATHLPVARYISFAGNSLVEIRSSKDAPAQVAVIAGTDPLRPPPASALHWRIVDLGVRNDALRDYRIIAKAFVLLDEPLFFDKIQQTYKEVAERLHPIKANELEIVIRGDSWFGAEQLFSGIDYFSDDLTIPPLHVIQSRTVYHCRPDQMPVCR